MSIAEDFAASQKAYSDLLRHVERYSADISRGYQGMGHRVNQQAAEVEDLWKAIEAIRKQNEKALDIASGQNEVLKEMRTLMEKIAAYLKKKFPEDFTGDKGGT